MIFVLDGLFVQFSMNIGDYHKNCLLVRENLGRKDELSYIDIYVFIYINWTNS